MNDPKKAARVDRLKKDAEEQKPIRAPETERTERDSRRTNPEQAARPSPEAATPGSDEGDDPKKPLI